MSSTMKKIILLIKINSFQQRFRHNIIYLEIFSWIALYRSIFGCRKFTRELQLLSHYNLNHYTYFTIFRRCSTVYYDTFTFAKPNLFMGFSILLSVCTTGMNFSHFFQYDSKRRGDIWVSLSQTLETLIGWIHWTDIPINWYQLQIWLSKIKGMAHNSKLSLFLRVDLLIRLIIPFGLWFNYKSKVFSIYYTVNCLQLISVPLAIGRAHPFSIMVLWPSFKHSYEMSQFNPRTGNLKTVKSNNEKYI